TKNGIKFSGLGCQYDSVSFEPQNTGSFVDYKWDFGDGSQLGAGKNVKHVFKAGTYTVKLYSKASSSRKLDTAVQKMTVYPVPEARMDINDTSQCLVGNAFRIKDRSSIQSGLIKKIGWDIEGHGAYSDSVVNIVYTTLGRFRVRLVAESDHA